MGALYRSTPRGQPAVAKPDFMALFLAPVQQALQERLSDEPGLRYPAPSTNQSLK
ncbi:MAG TPA: hypothetical protein VF947_03545 [Myxococcales bacterium]